MLKNYLTIALRFMARQKGFSFINLSGLTLGIASTLLILLYITDELSYDRFHRAPESIYRITRIGKMEGKKINSAFTSYRLAYALKKDSAKIEDVVRIANWATFPMRYENNTFTEPNLLLADENFFRFFSFVLLEGDQNDVLKGEGKLVITESTAKRYFSYTGKGDVSPIGKKMILAQGYEAVVTGIAADPPLQSHFGFTAILSLDSWTELRQDNSINSRVITYVRLKAGATTGDLKASLNTFMASSLAPELKELRNQDLENYRMQGNELKFGYQPLVHIHLRSSLSDEIGPNGNITYIYLFSIVAAFITLLACINFMNLSTARSASRAREIGVRKAVGALNSRLVLQFLLESYFYIVIAVVFALFIIMVSIGPFNVFTKKDLDSSAFLSTAFLSGIVVFTLATGLLAGSYPAFYLIHYNPTEVLKGRIRNYLRSYGIRNVLVVFQFFISSGLIIATLTIYNQLRFIQKLEVGFDKSNVINLIHTANLGDNGKKFKEELLREPFVISAGYSNLLPPNISWQYVFRPDDTTRDYLLNVYEMDYDHFSTMGYTILKGRYFSPDFPADSLAVILNETAVRRLKLESLLNQKLVTDYGPPGGTKREVIGVVKDFNFQSPKDSIQPVALVLGREPNWEMAIRIKAGQEEPALERIRLLWKKWAPTAPFEYTFLDSNFALKLAVEKRVGILFLLFTLLAVFIACLGLFGLATFTAEQRTKEIGIRKVLGATVADILVMLNKDFLKLVLIANLIAWPVAGWLMNQWLNSFAYHRSISWWVFAVAGSITVVIAFVSVSTRAFRAAGGDPVNSLRNE